MSGDLQARLHRLIVGGAKEALRRGGASQQAMEAAKAHARKLNGLAIPLWKGSGRKRVFTGDWAVTEFWGYAFDAQHHLSPVMLEHRAAKIFRVTP